MDDVEASAQWSPEWRELCRVHGVRACHSTPILSDSGKPVASFVLCLLEPRGPEAWERQIAEFGAYAAGIVLARDRAAAALRESEERHRLLAEQVADGIFVADSKGRYLDANQAGAAMLGYTIEELLKLRIHDVIAPEELPRLPEHLEELSSGGLVVSDWQLQRKDGSRFVGELVARRFPDGRFQGVVRDVTERRKAEEKLREIQERLTLAIEGAGMGTWDVDLRTGASIWSDRHFQMLGYQPTPDGSATVQMWRSRVHNEDLEKVDLAMQRAFSGEAQYVSDHRIIRADTGELRWLSEFGHCILDAQGQATRFIGMSFDNTARNRAEERLRVANQDLEQFAYSASHDLQEPLRSVNIYSELLTARLRGKLDGDTVEYLEYIRAGATRMQALLRDLLAYAQASRREDKAVEPVDANQCFQAAISNLEASLAESGASLSCDLLPTVRVDATHLQQLFQNLIGNAVKYRRPGIAPEVSISAEMQSGRWQFSVRDNGIGIDPQYQNRIFGLFKRLHSQREYSGTGIGLALCSRIVEQYGGRIWVESEPGKGSTFYFTLPA
ncbi:MAG: PAS domain S-box protein [Acidobacteriaceae bacterium]|nr:PAS domain S-box protein [Acidobacteriaceae bacterium]